MNLMDMMMMKGRGGLGGEKTGKGQWIISERAKEGIEEKGLLA